MDIHMGDHLYVWLWEEMREEKEEGDIRKSYSQNGDKKWLSLNVKIAGSLFSSLNFSVLSTLGKLGLKRMYLLLLRLKQLN